MAEEIHDHDRGLAFDLPRLLDRRAILAMIAGAGVLTIAGCGGSGDTASNAGSATSGSATSGSGTGTSGTGAAGTGAAGTSAAAAAGDDCAEIPAETAGPFPADGSNGPDVLSRSGVVRRDIRSSFGSATGLAEGVPLEINLSVVDAANGCAALAGAAVYLWHCDRDGRYSVYALPEQNYLRGIQVANGDGQVSFLSVFPGAYSGRWPHVHFEVYPSLAAATGSGEPLVTSQLALPEAACAKVYATAGYGQSAANLGRTSLATDNVFSDGWQTQLGTVSGSLPSGLAVALTVPVAA